MDIQEQIAVIVHTISHQGGRIDALNATLLSMLHLAKSSPGLREAIEAQLEQNYSSLLARSENPQYVAGFESVRDQIVAARDGAARRIHGRCPWPGPAAATRHSYPHLLWTSLGIVRVQPGKTLSLQALDRTAQQWRRPGARGSRHAGLKPGNMRPHAESVSIGNTGPGVLRQDLGSGKAGGVRPRQTLPRRARAGSAWGMTSRPGMTSTSAIPSCAAWRCCR